MSTVTQIKNGIQEDSFNRIPRKNESVAEQLAEIRSRISAIESDIIDHRIMNSTEETDNGKT